MDKLGFIDLDKILGCQIKFKFPSNGNDVDGLSSVFYVYKDNNKYKISFEINETDLKSNNPTIEEKINKKYSNLENCFKLIGLEYIKENILKGTLKDDKVSILKIDGFYSGIND